MSQSTRKRKIQAGVKQLEQDGDLDAEADKEDKKVLDKLQTGANAETGLLCQHRKRTSCTNTVRPCISTAPLFYNLSLIQMCLIFRNNENVRHMWTLDLCNI